MERMKKGELITSPDDPRAKTLPQKVKESLKNNITGFAAPINTETQDMQNKIYTIEEVGRMKPEEFLPNQDRILEDFTTGKMMREKEAQEKVQTGEIYVKSYTRSDGTKVSDYYRRR